MKPLKLKFSLNLLPHLILLVAIIIVLVVFWINYLGLKKFEQSLESSSATTPAIIVDDKLYNQVLEKIDARQKIITPKPEEIKNILPPPSTKLDNPTRRQ
jgi:sensor domain CHASE-containing protein